MANGKVGRPRGLPKYGGRQKGTKNKKTIALENFAQFVVEMGSDRFLEEMESLKGKPFIDAFLQMFKYVMPQLARQEITGLGGDQIVIAVKTAASADGNV